MKCTQMTIKRLGFRRCCNNKKESWNIQENLRITEVEEVIEGNKITITPTFGTPLKETFTDDDN